MTDVMPHRGEEGLNIVALAADDAESGCPLFERAAWFEELHRACLPDRPAVTIEAAHDGAQCRLHLMATAPGHLAALANWYSFRWQPCFTGADGPARMAALTAALREARRQASRLSLSPVAVEHGVADQLAAALRLAGWTVGRSVVSRSHWLATRGRSFDQWWAERPGRLRSTVKRKGAKGIVRCEIHHDFNEAHWDAYEAVYAASWKTGEAYPQFLREWARRAAREGALRLGLARMDGHVVAAQFWTVDAGTAHIHKLAQIRDAAVDTHSPGTLLTHAMFAHAFDKDRVARIDFGTGDDGYKRDWMEESADLIAITAVDLRQPGGWWSLAREGLTRVAGRLHKS